MALSGQTTITEAGTAEPLGTGRIDGPLIVKALPNNTGLVCLGAGHPGGVDTSTGFLLAPGEPVVLAWVGSLGSLMLDAAVSGEGVSWLALDA